jgi:hypothetical protein
MRTPPLFQSDEEAEMQAEQARQQGTTLIRSHLSHHFVNNPNSSYVTWISTLHPENADVVIDQRFLIPGNPWWTVYEETKTPTATAVPIAGEGEDPSTITYSTSTASTPHFCLRCSPLDLTVGVSFALIALLTTLVLEVTACSFYVVAAIFYGLAKPCDPPNVFTGMLYSIFMLNYWIFALIDSLLLLISVLFTELLAIAAFCMSICLGGILMALYWHQCIRRVCHMTRWASRRGCSNPPRHFVFCGRDEFKKDMDGSEVPAIPTAASAPVVIVDKASVVVEQDTRDSARSIPPYSTKTI